MYRTLLLFFLLVHMIGDFYLQNDDMAKEKLRYTKTLWKHCALYAFAFLAVPAFYRSVPLMITAAALALAHCLIDFMKYWIRKNHTARAEPDAFAFDSASFTAKLYGFDQGLHILTILIAVIIVRFFSVPIVWQPYLQTLGHPLPIDPMAALQWFFLVVFIWRPANITIKCLTAHYSPKETDASIANAGAFIGTLERILIVILLSQGEYAAIGLVLAAKSVARYEQLKEKQFAEYYLLGTLLSTLWAIGAYSFIFILL